jgi:hypothetical protein
MGVARLNCLTISLLPKQWGPIACPPQATSVAHRTQVAQARAKKNQTLNKKYLLTLGGLVAVAILSALWFTQSASTPNPSLDKQAANDQETASHLPQPSHAQAAIKPMPGLSEESTDSKPIPNVAGEAQVKSESDLGITPIRGHAKLQVGGNSFAPQNFSGRFERVAVAPQQTVPVVVTWPEEPEGREVTVHSIDGGKINNGKNIATLKVDSEHSIKFAFTPNRDPGQYQVVLRRGTEEEALEFWIPTAKPQYDPPTLH